MDASGLGTLLAVVLIAALAPVIVAVLASFGIVRDFVPIGLALTTTALGTLLPILQDNDMLGGKFGRYVLAAGAVGELFPIVAISLFLTKRDQFIAIGSLLAVALAALALTAAPRVIGERRLRALIKQGQRATAQTTLRWSCASLPLLIALAEIGLRDGVMLPSNAAALVGAGVVSVLLFPAIAAAISRRGKANRGLGEPIPVAGAADELPGVAEQLRRWRHR